MSWCRYKNVKQIRASSGPGGISWFKHITEFPSTLLHADHSLSFYQPNLAQEMANIFFTKKAQLLPQPYHIYSFKDVLYLGPLKKR